MTEQDLRPASAACPVCRAELARQPVVRVQPEPPVDFLRCPACLGISASRMPTTVALADYYSTYYDRFAEELVTFDRPERLARLIARHVPREGGRRMLRLLDMGGGDGTISRLCASRLIEDRVAASCEITVVDYVEKPFGVSQDAVECSFVTDLSEIEGRFDVVIASAILEHIPDFHATFGGLIDRLGQGGLFYSRTPYMTPFATIFRSMDLTYPAHVHDLGGAFWTRMAERLEGEVDVVLTAPSIVETVMSRHPARTAAASILKMPARLLAAGGLPPLWPYYGGWQVLWTKVRDGRQQGPD